MWRRRRRHRPRGGRASSLRRAVALLGTTAACLVVLAAVPVGLAVDPAIPVAVGETVPPAARAGPPPIQPPAAPEERDFIIVATGDLLIHAPVYGRALHLGGGTYDFRPLFAPIRPLIQSAALAICHVETPMGAGPPSSYPIFDTPVELATAIRWTGWDVCDTASNHSLDEGQHGIEATAHALDRAGVDHTGSFASEAASHRILVRTVKGVRIAFLAYSYGTNGFGLPHPWSVNLISEEKIRSDAARARQLGADLVMVNLHWGTQFVHAPDQQQVSLAGALLRDHVADLVIGQHVHVIQPIERIAGRFVVFGEGNLISAEDGTCCPPETQDGMIVQIHVHAVDGRASITGVDYVPTWVDHPGYEVLPVGATLARLAAWGRGDGLLAAELRRSYARTVGYAGTGPHLHPEPDRLP